MKSKKRLVRIVIPVLLICMLIAGAAVWKTVQYKNSHIDVPVLLYHHIDERGEGGSTIQTATFLSHLDALDQAGYTTITIEQMIDFVENGTKLPKKSVVITFDDGYLSNYQIAFPALAERNMKATIFVIGISAGKDTYKDTGKSILPHFSYEQAREMVESGVISLQTHTYDMHQYQPLEPDGGREGVLPREYETNEQYLQALRNDFQRGIRELETEIREPVIALAYPFGAHSSESEQICDELGIPVTFTIESKHAGLVKGERDSLRLLGRYYMDDISAEELLEMIRNP